MQSRYPAEDAAALVGNCGGRGAREDVAATDLMDRGADAYPMWTLARSSCPLASVVCSGAAAAFTKREIR